MVTEDHKRLMEDAHKAYYRLQLIIDSVRLIHKADDMCLDSAELALLKVMDRLEEAVPDANERGMLRAVEGGKG